MKTMFGGKVSSMKRTKLFHALNVVTTHHKLKIWACPVSIVLDSHQLKLRFYYFLIFHIWISCAARSHKFGRQGQGTYDDDDEATGDYSYGGSYGQGSYDDEGESDDDEDYEEDDDDDESDEESEEEK